MGSVGDLTAADEQLRNLAEALGENGTTPNDLRNPTDYQFQYSMVLQSHQKGDEHQFNNHFALPTFAQRDVQDAENGGHVNHH